ncbi:cytochrome c biogenesis CcdA family protein [Actinoplanes sp. RD1]|uniref:cytochrome c biogenesis CcdA family protein n=1 Tax=Actinoplanes sp. RD1 TaxID=3064538 RepID=UPI0027415A76|nr:cytochrome c biogenesis protein CcdA [Actinoplanes sp. RD1]
MGTPLLLALTAGMLAAVNPCGFAVLPAYLSVLVARDRPLSRALVCTAALTTGFVAVFGTFGLLLMPLAGTLQPRLPWLTVAFGLLLAGLGGWLLAGRSLLSTGRLARAPRLTGTLASMVLFGMAYAIASLGCAIGPFLALVASGLRAGPTLSGSVVFLAYAAGMGLVVGMTAVAVALLRQSVVTRMRRVAAWVPRAGGAVLMLTGAYVAWYGVYELRLVKDLGTSGQDPVVNLASAAQRELSDLVRWLGAGRLTVLFAVLVLTAVLSARRRRTAVGS